MDYSAITALLSPDILSTLSTIGAVCYAIALAATKLPLASETSPKWYKTIRAVVDFVAANFGNAKNIKG